MVTMTGRELIIYILENNLEDQMVFSNGIFTGIMDVEQAALKFNVGVATVRAWYQLGMLPGFTMGGSLFFMKDVPNPLENKKGADCNG